MVISKQRQLAAKPTNKKNAQGGSLNPSNPNIESDLLGGDGWVIVKRQRVTILIPPIPVTTKSKMANQGPAPLDSMPRKIADDQSRPSDQTCTNLSFENVQEKSKSLAHKKVIEIASRSPAQYISTLAKCPASGLRIEPENPVGVVASRSHKIHGMPETSKTIKRPRSTYCPNIPIAGNNLLNRRLRLSNLERKLQQAGGLSRWLMSLGLGQFVRIFQAKSISKFQLVNLNMQKLKDMGADAVGPRRKLIHAIDCVCQPFCFEPV